MQQSNATWTIYSLNVDLETNMLALDHKLQRKVGQWTSMQKSLLIDSIVKGYGINTIYVLTDEFGRKSVIDGVQRIHTIHEYLHGGFALSRKLDPILLPAFGTSKMTLFDIAGKKFDKLDEEVKAQIRKYELSIKLLSVYTDKELKEMFLRLNNATPMNKTQKAIVLFEDLLLDRVVQLLDHKFWTKMNFTGADLRKSNDRQVVMQTLYGLYTPVEENMGFKQPVIDRFIIDMQTGVSDDEINAKQIALFNMIYDIIDKMDECIPTTLPLMNKISIPPMIIAALPIRDDDELLQKYAEVMIRFFSTEYTGSEYEYMCKYTSDTANRENVVNRIEFFEDIVKRIQDGREVVFGRHVETEVD